MRCAGQKGHMVITNGTVLHFYAREALLVVHRNVDGTSNQYHTERFGGMFCLEQEHSIIIGAFDDIYPRTFPLELRLLECIRADLTNVTISIIKNGEAGLSIKLWFAHVIYL